MPRRFADIRRANELETALTNYKDWLDQSFQDSKRKTGGTVGPARKRVFIYLTPFSFNPNFNTQGAFRVTRSIDSNARLGTLDGRVLLEQNPGGYLVFNKGESPCRVFLFESNGSRSYVQSKITKLFYLKFDGDSYSTPMGRKTQTEREAEGVADAFTHLRTLAAAKDYVRVWHKPEDLVARKR